MANNLSKNVTQMIARKFLPAYDDSTVTLNTVDKSILPKGSINPQTGSTKQVKRPHQYKTIETSTGNISGATKSDIIAATATMTVQNFLSEYVQYDILEEAIELDQLDEILRPIATKMATDEEVRFNKFMINNAAHFLGTAGNAINSWDDIAEAPAFMKALAIPVGETYVQIDPYSCKNLADAQTGLSGNGDVKTAWDDAKIGRKFAGSQVYLSNSLANHSAGTYTGSIQVASAPTQTYLGAKDTYQTSIPLKGLGIGTTLLQGDVIKVTGRNWLQMQTKQRASKSSAPIEYTAVVTADVTADGGGLATVVVSGPAIFEAAGNYNTIDSAIATNDAVTVVSGAASAVNTPSMFYHQKAFGYCPVVLPKLHSTDSSVITAGGHSMRVSKGSNFLENENLVRFDLLSAYACYNPLWAGRLFGQ